MKEDSNYKVLGGQGAQQTLKSVLESFRIYNVLLKAFWKGEVNMPRLPVYRKKGGLALITYPSQAISFDLETGDCLLPISRELNQDVNNDLGLNEIRIKGCFCLHIYQIAEVMIIPQYQQFYAEYVYQKKLSQPSKLDYSLELGIDHGVTNWLTCLSNQGQSFIVDGRKLKAINQGYNRQFAQIKQGKLAKYWDDTLSKITDKRNNQSRDAVNKPARFVINYCLNHKIGNIVFGWNTGNKYSIKIGKKNNQNFVQITTARLKKIIEELCYYYGIVFTETEESYNSKSSFIDHDLLPKFGEKPASMKFSGRRINRGLYQTKTMQKINADAQGAANILKKVKAQLNLNLVKVCRGYLIVPKRYDLSKKLNKLYPKRCESMFLITLTTTA
ncbi:MAG: IS200/IS605 family element transposase accessory protein TnpB [Moorea sp. SIO2B7]|nr:IS200/IS605 family element transposase accessory protein TnpB [Moorena sp. SIO2B7]